MIPRLYKNTETTFTGYGICPLVDCIECLVTEERNGEYTMSLTYARDGQWANELTADRIVLADPYDNAAQPEPFRIYEITYDINGNIVVNANHISYQLNDVVIGKFVDATRYPWKAWDNAVNHQLTANPFSFSSDINDDAGTVYRFELDKPASLRSYLGGMDGSMVDCFGGELEWNRYTVNLWSARGNDNGVKIAYTKNLTGLNYDIDLSELHTGAVAFYNSGSYVEGTVQTVANSYSYNRVMVLDATMDFGSTPTVAQLNTYASNWLTANPPTPSVSVDVTFIPLWQTEEYKEFYGLEHVALCDTVEVVYPPLNIDVKAKVVRTVYNVLADRYEELTISTIRSSLADTIYSLMK